MVTTQLKVYSYTTLYGAHPYPKQVVAVALACSKKEAKLLLEEKLLSAGYSLKVRATQIQELGISKKGAFPLW